jgi:hypothetical protein
MIRISEADSMLLASTGIIHTSQQEEKSALLRCKIEELNNNTVLLIAQAETLIQESKQLSARIKALDNASTKAKSASLKAH